MTRGQCLWVRSESQTLRWAQPSWRQMFGWLKPEDQDLKEWNMLHGTVFTLQIGTLKSKTQSKSEIYTGHLAWDGTEVFCLFVLFFKKGRNHYSRTTQKWQISQMTPKVWPPLGLRWNGLLQPIWSPGWLSRIRPSLLETTRYVGISSLEAHRSVIKAALNGPPTCNCGIKNKAACYSHKLQFCFRSREQKTENTLCLSLPIRACLGYAAGHDYSLHSKIFSRWAA